MSVPSLDQISAAILAAVTGPIGPYNLPGARGRYGLAPPRYPWVALSAAAVQSVQGPVMGQYTRTVVYDMEAWVPATSPLLDTRVIQAEELADLLIGSLDDTRSNPESVLYSLITWTVRSATLDAAADPIPVTAVMAMLTIELSYRRARGLMGSDP